MPRNSKLLTAKAVARITAPGRHAIGGGVYLVVKEDGARQFWARGTDPSGRRAWRVLGGPEVTIQEAREKARGKLAEPPKAAKARPTAGVRTFGEAAQEFVALRLPTWKHKAHRRQWEYSLELLAPLNGIGCADLTARDVAGVLHELQDRPETLSRVRARIEQILDAEFAGAGLLDRANPAQLRIQSHLVPALSADRRKRAKRAREKHPAPTLEQVRGLWRGLPDTTAAKALRLVLLTAIRTSEARLIRWRDWDARARLLAIPAEVTKTATAHVVPVPVAAMPLLAKPGRKDALIFPGRAPKGAEVPPLSQDSLRMAMRRGGVKGGEATVHGVRSTFRDWCRDNAKDEVLAELALGHSVGSESERAYARSTALERRRDLMQEWADAVTAPDADGAVVPMRRAR